MSTFFQALMSQHSRSLKPLRFVEQMTLQLQSFFEEVVLENELSCMVIESLSVRNNRSLREVERVRSISDAAEKFFLLVSEKDDIGYRIDNYANLKGREWTKKPQVVTRKESDQTDETFLIVSGNHFSVLFAAMDDKSVEADAQFGKTQQVVWSFDPDTVFTAMEYMQGRFAAEHPEILPELRETITRFSPKTISLPMTLAVTTKLASNWQEQAGREIAVNRVANAIRGSLELEEILQTTVDEVGMALNADLCALRIEAENGKTGKSVSFHPRELSDEEQINLDSDLVAYSRRMSNNATLYLRDGLDKSLSSLDKPVIVTPICLPDKFFGVLFLQSNDVKRIWQHNESLLIQTVADQVAIAVNHARLHEKTQKEALTDSLTGLFNRRFFEIQLEREYKTAMRKKESLSLIVVDIDHFKHINDTFGHTVGDMALQEVAFVLADGVRTTDTVSRFGGEEFVIILPQTGGNEATIIAERLRESIADAIFSEIGTLTISLGVASCPENTNNWLDLFKIADESLYEAKQSGRNCVRLSTKGKDEVEKVLTETEKSFWLDGEISEKELDVLAEANFPASLYQKEAETNEAETSEPETGIFPTQETEENKVLTQKSEPTKNKNAENIAETLAWLEKYENSLEKPSENLNLENPSGNLNSEIDFIGESNFGNKIEIAAKTESRNEIKTDFLRETDVEPEKPVEKESISFAENLSPAS